MKLITAIALFLTLLAFSNCSNTKPDTAESLYTKGMKQLSHHEYSAAAESFEKIDTDFPFSRWATKGKIVAVYARYKDEDYAKTIQAVDDFVRLSPNSEYVPYALYMKGLSFYQQIPSIERAQDNTQQASYTFRELIARFPTDIHALDAESKLDFIDEHIAGSRMSVGRLQADTQNFVGAIGNFNDVIRLYRQTKQVPEAYFRLVEIYTKIGLKREAKTAYYALQAKYPYNYWAQLAEKLIAEYGNA